MPIRHRWAIGDHLLVDDIDGKVRYASEVRETWNGLLTRARGRDGDMVQNPQDFVRAPPPEAAPWDIRTAEPTSATAVLDVDIVRGVILPKGAAQHLYSNSGFGIGEMEVSSGSAESIPQAFVVR